MPADVRSSNPSLVDAEEIAAYYANWELELKRPALFGYCFDILLYGFLTVQVYLYHLAFPNDKKLTKMAIYLVYTIGSIQTVFALRDFYELFCFPGRLAQAESTTPSDLHGFGFMWLTIPVSSALVAMTVQLFYAQRIWIVSHSKSITLTVAFLALAQLGSGIFSALTIYGRAPSLATFFSSVSTINAGLIVNVFIWGLVGALCDFVIAVFMFVYISKQTKGTSKTTQKSLIRIKRLVLETGLLTVMAAVSYTLLSAFPIFFNSESTWSQFMVPGLLLSKLYSNSMLAVLNNRVLIDKGRYAGHTAEITFYEPSVATGTQNLS